MKKLFTLRNVLVWAGALLAIVAFFVAFAAGLKVQESKAAVTLTNVIIGKQYVIIGTFKEEMDPEQAIRSVLSLVGIIIGLVAGVGLACIPCVVKDAKARRILVLVAAGLMVVGVVMVALVRVGYAADLVRYYKGDKEPKTFQEVWERMMKDNYKANGGVIATGLVLGFGAVATAASEFVPDVALVK